MTKKNGSTTLTTGKPIPQGQGKHYIYVARDKDSCAEHNRYLVNIGVDDDKMYNIFENEKTEKRILYSGGGVDLSAELIADCLKIELKPGEQVRIPIDVERAEKV